MRVADRPPDLQDRIRRTGLFIAYVAISLFFLATGFILFRWYQR